MLLPIELRRSKQMDDQVVYHRRRAAAEYIRNKYAQSVSPNLLSKLAVNGGGPPFRKIGGDAIYEESDLDAYAQSRIGRKISSTAELTVGRLKRKTHPAKKAERRASVNSV
jgi:hypothetical protein